MKIGENSTAEQYVTGAGRFWEEGDGLIDAHAHIGTEEEIRERIRDGIPSVICAGSPKEAEQLKRLFNRFEVHPVIIPAAGLHPWNSDKYRAEEMFPFMEEWPVMGEIGLDTLWCDVPLNVQKEAFECQLDFAVKKRKPAVLHTKEQEAEIAGSCEDILTVIWFTGIPADSIWRSIWIRTAMSLSGRMWCGIRRFRRQPDRCLRIGFS